MYYYACVCVCVCVCVHVCSCICHCLYLLVCVCTIMFCFGKCCVSINYSACMYPSTCIFIPPLPPHFSPDEPEFWDKILATQDSNDAAHNMHRRSSSSSKLKIAPDQLKDSDELCLQKTKRLRTDSNTE